MAEEKQCAMRSHEVGPAYAQLINASRDGHVECVQRILLKEVDVNYTDWNYQCTALCYAITRQHVHVAKLLIENGSNIFDIHCRHGCIPYMFYVLCNNDEITMRMLIGAGADINEQLSRMCRNASLLMTGAYLHMYNIMKLLLESGCRIDITNDDGYNSLYFSLTSPFGPRVEHAMVLYAAGADIDIASQIQIRTREVVDVAKYLPEVPNDRNKTLFELCRQKIRKHLLSVNNKTNLFCTIPRLNLPDLLEKALLYNTCLK